MIRVIFRNNRAHCPHCDIPLKNLPAGAACGLCSTTFSYRSIEADRVASLSPEARIQESKVLAKEILNIQKPEDRKNLSIVNLDSHELPKWKKIISLLGVPVEESEYNAHRLPLVSLAFVILCIFVALKGDRAMMHLAFDPTHPFKNFGLNFFTYSLAHGGIVHLLGNMFFLWPFMDNVEEHLGHLKTFIFIFVSAVVSSGIHFTATNSHVPLVGASGVCFGMAALYCLRYPKNRFLIALPMIGIFAFNYRIRLKARTLFLYFIALEFFDIFKLSSGVDNISHWGHIGGAFAGIVFYRLNKALDA